MKYLDFLQMAASRIPALDDDAPSLDPSAIERAYLRERARRRRRTDHRTEVRSSKARFWVVLAVLVFLTVCFALFTWHQVQTTFGV